MSDFDLGTANGPQMKAWAANNIDLKLVLTMKEETMREKIYAKCQELNIEPPVKAIQTSQDKRRKIKETVLINIPKSERQGGLEPVFVGVQGTGYLIPRGMDVEVSPSIVEVLKNAITDNVTQDEEGELQHDEVPTYPFSIIRQAQAA